MSKKEKQKPVAADGPRKCPICKGDRRWCFCDITLPDGTAL